VEPLAWLAKRGTFAINLDRATDSALFAQVMLAGSQEGHTRVRPQTILLHGARCRQGAPQADLVVEPARSGGVSLRGPVVGSFRGPDVRWPVSDTYRRDQLADPAPDLVDSLIERTSQVMDSLLAARLPAREVPLTGGLRRLAINSWPMRTQPMRYRSADDGGSAPPFAERPAAPRGAGACLHRDDLGCSLAWQQVVFLPTLLGFDQRGQPAGGDPPRRYTGAGCRRLAASPWNGTTCGWSRST
jgi:hypothetical protein